MNNENMKQQLTTDPIAAKRTIERIKLHQSTLSPDYLLLFPGGSLEDQRALIGRYDDSDPIEFWKSVLEENHL